MALFEEPSYVSGSKTMVPTPERADRNATRPSIIAESPAQPLSGEPDIKIEETKYGEGKPFRIVRRGRIVHDRK